MWYKLKRIMMRPNGVEKQVRPIWWQPWANTIAYFPFKEDALDEIGSRSLTINNCTISDWVMNINSQASYMLLSSSIWWSQITGSVWYYYWALSTWWGWNTLFAKNWWDYHHILMPATTSGWTVWNIGFFKKTRYPSSKTLELWKWYHIVFVKNWTNEKIYVNAELVLDSNSSFDNNSQPLWIIANYTASSWNQWAQWKMSELFFEDKLRTVQEISDYYNQTKANYWL